MKKGRLFLRVILVLANFFLILSCRPQSEAEPLERYIHFELFSPTDAAIEVDRDIKLKWRVHAYDANSQPPSFNLYFGTDSDPEFLSVILNDGNDVKHSVGPLSPGTTYYWRVTAFDETPEVSSKIQSFQVAFRDRKIWSNLNYVYEPLTLLGDKLYATEYKKITCLDSGDGKIVWRWEIDDLTSEAAAGQGKVFIPSERLYCLDAETGDLLWTNEAGKSIWGDALYIGGKVFSVNVDLYCVDAATGETVWTHGEIEGDTGIKENLSVSGSRVVCVRSNTADDGGSRLFCLEAGSGALVWEHEDWSLESIVHGPAVSEDHICLKTDCELRMYDLTSGQLLWTYPTPQNCGDTPYLFDGKVFTNNGDNQFVLLDQSTGEEIWRVDYTGTNSVRSGAPVVINGILYLTLDEGYVMALDVLSGAIVWVYYIDASGDGIHFLEDHLYLTTDDDGVHCLAAD